MKSNGSGNGRTGSSAAMAGKAFSSRQPKTAVPAGATVNLVTVTEDRNSRLAASRTADKRTVVGGPPATNGSTTITKKRKSCNDGPASGRLEATSSRAVSKKIKLDTAKEKPCTQSSASDSSLALDKSILSPEVWHYIFTFCPPKSLGNLMAVNKLFNLYLDPASSVRREVPVSTKNGVLGLLKPNAIWQASRRLFWSQMPAPIRPNTELDRWRLVCSPRCQDCGKLDAREQSSPPDPRRPGPGPNGVAIVWAFSRRMCASCLLKKTVKEVDLLLSASLPTAVIPALPFVFLTEDLHVFSATTLQQHQLPRHLQITKRFLSSDVESLEREFLEVKDMGPGTVSEWLKGIAGRGNGIQHDAAKWEKWQSSGGTARMRSQLYPGYRKRTPTSLPADSATNPSSAQMPNPLIPTALRQSFPDGRHERTAEEVAELKAARKAEVERRALSLDPPLTADVLRHIPSFQAAIHIAAPLDDHAWEILKPRLLAQRAGAERVRESEASQQTQGRRHVETTLATTKEARDRVDKDWEEVQAPLRVEISGYADQLIRDFRAKNKKVTKGNCARFAIYTLLHVRRLFYARVAVGAAAARAAGQAPQIDPPEGPFTQKLTIENMKWIFDTKIKPRTEPLRKELFYCNDCEGNPRAFGFESVIQHYAAKHTKALSLGNMVVHWRAEWPEHPPFSAEARPAKPPSNLSDPTSSAVDAGQPSRMSCSYQPPETAPAPPLAYPPNAGYGFSVPTYSDYYQQQQQPPPPPVQPYQPQVSPAPFPLQPSYGPTPYPSYQTPAIPYPTPAVEPPQTYVPPQGGQHDYQYGLYQPSVNGPNARPQPSAHADLYQAKLADIARNSREVWRLLGDIKDLPGSARVFVTIHHLVKRFRSRFYETPPLSLFIDGLSDNKDMRPVRNVNGLVCKACHLGLGNAASVEQDRKSFSLPQLSKHFQSKHVEPMQRLQPPSPAAPLDWVVDMVLLPEPAVISRLSSSVNATQRSLVTAALPDAFVAQAGHNAAPVHADQGRRHEPVAAASFFPVSTDDPSKRQTRNGYTAGQGAPNKYPAAAEPAGAGFLADYRRRAESRHSATPATVPDNDRSAHSEVDRHSSQSCRQGGGQNGSQSRKGGKKKRGEKQDRSGPDDRTLGETFRTDDRVIKREDADMCDTHAMKPLETAVSQLRSARPEQVQSVGASQPQAQTELEKNTSRRSHPAPLADGKKEPDIIAGLESHLDQRLPAQPHGQQPLSNAAFYADSRAPIIPQEFQRASEAYSRQDEREDWPSYPGLGSGYQAVGPASRHGGPRGAELEAAYYPRMAPIERQEERHHIQRAQGGFIEALPRRTEEGRFDPAIAWPEEGRGHGAAPREAGYYRHCEGVRMHSRPLVEAYEIVHVIDEHGEYYIRRPVRRQPDSRYGYEERRVHRDARSYAAPERVYTPISRPTLVREAGRAEMGTEGWSAGRRVDAAYYEEYDPRFPAA